MKLIRFIVEAISWISIFLSPAAILTFSALVVYYNYPNIAGKIIFILLSIVGITFGIFLAERIRRKTGCTEFMSRISKWS